MSRHNKIQKPSFGNNSTPKKSSFFNQANSWRNPYQQSNAEASEQPTNIVKPPTAEEWLKDNIMLRAIETRQAQLQKQQLEENSDSEQQLEPTSTTPLEAVQAKLTVGAPGDKYEQEADQMAEQVMSMEAPTVQQQPIQHQDEELSESIQKQPLSASITPLVQPFAEAKGQAKSNKEPLFTSKESYRESIQLKALQGKHIDIANVSPGTQAKWLDNRFHTVKPTTKEQPIQRQSEESEQSIQRNSFDATITPYVQCLTKVIQRLNEVKLQAKASPSLESRLASQTGGGSPLDEQTRSFMEPRFGADFNKVRVHTDTTAVQMNKELGAKAFAHGSDVYFGEGQAPGNNKLTAHELTHVVQQGGAVRMNQVQLQPEEKAVKSNKPQLSSEKRFALANVIQQLLRFFKPIGEFVAGAVYQWLHNNGEPARWLLQALIPGWNGLERDVERGLPKTWPFQAGRAFGDGAALVTGILEIVEGGSGAAGGVTLCLTGGGCVVGAPAIAASTVLGLHGASTANAAARNIAARLGVVFHSRSAEGNSEPERAKRSSTQSHEEVGGHTNQRHVGKSENWLRKRLAEDPNVESASSFYNEEVANRTQGRFVKQFHKEIEAWRRSGKPRLVKEFDMDKPIGIVVRRNKKGSPLRAVETNRARLILVSDNSAQGWHFLTSFPIK